jgi:hypothetical protein
MPNLSFISRSDSEAAHELLNELELSMLFATPSAGSKFHPKILDDLHGFSTLAKALIQKYPDCPIFFRALTRIQQNYIHPVRARWAHRLNCAALDPTEQQQFDADITGLQTAFWGFTHEVRMLASRDPQFDQIDIQKLADPIKYGISKEWGMPDPEADTKRKTRQLKDVENINMDEKTAVQTRRKLINDTRESDENAVGLALSGGGIRSSTFSLGVTQALADKGLMKEVDFLSTVSGGGYIGSFLTSRVGEADPEKSTVDQTWRGVGEAKGPDPSAIRYMRRRAQYLSSSDLSSLWSTILSTIAGMLMNWLVPVAFIAFAALLAHVPRIRQWGFGDWVFSFYDVSVFLITSGGILSIIALIAYAAFTRIDGWVSGDAIRLLRHFIWPLAVGVAGVLIWGGYQVFLDLVIPDSDENHRVVYFSVAGVVSFLSVAAPIIMRFLPIFKSRAIRSSIFKCLLWIAGIVVPALALIGFYTLYYFTGLETISWLPESIRAMSPWKNVDGVLVVFGLVFLPSSLITFLFLNINSTSPHRLYRSRLAHTFVSHDGDDRKPRPLSDINKSEIAPYHLINATLNLPSSRAAAMRDRKCDFFLFSKCWTGSQMTGYFKTPQFRTGRYTRVDLAAAMAISGAAASPHMGLNTKSTLRPLMTLLNIRLGYWIQRPDVTHYYSVPGYVCLLREMTQMGMTEQSPWMNVSDGGHIENLGVYELLRRRCKYIICVDGECDPGYEFDGLMKLVRHAQIDFGIRIQPSLRNLTPDENTNLSRCHALLCHVHYPPSS